MGFGVTSITVSMEVSNKDYGTGETRFCSLRADTQDPTEAIPLDQLHEAVFKVMDMLHAASEAIHQTRYAQGDLGGKELTSLLQTADKRLERVKAAYLEAIQGEQE